MIPRVELLAVFAAGVFLIACSSPGGDPPEPDGGCDPVACAATLPEPACSNRGDAVVTVTGSLGCSAFGTCEYETVEEPCEYGCEDAVCEIPCNGLTCNRPGRPYCEGNSVLTPTGEGELYVSSCVCRYEETEEDCGEDTCVDGECVPFSCDLVTCDDPPADECDGDFALIYDGSGECDDDTFECSYSFDVLDCAADGLACDDGECVDLCDAVTCDAPPEPTCADSVLTTWSAEGVCQADGSCEYEPTDYDCASEDARCTDGACVPLCVDADCDSPPADDCVDNIAIQYETAGTCTEEFDCDYAHVDVDCEALGLVCIDGACSEEPTCIGVTCDTAPDSFCDGTVARSFLAPGVCEPGPECVFEEVSEDCALEEGQVCIDGSCVPFCDTVTCDEPPVDSCDGEVALQYTAAGECDPIAEDCSYEFTTVDCAESDARCFEGECFTGCVPGLCTTPPEGLACSGTTVIAFTDTATCSPVGECLYAPEAVEDCSPRACHEGECVPACGDEFCIHPPASTCDDDVLVYYESIGDCIGGACDYRDFETDCTESALRCIDDPFDGGAACRDACDGYLACDVLPPSYCVDDTLMIVSFPAECADSECMFTETPFDCTADGDVCSEGACVDPCVGVICDTPPADFCAGTVAVEFEGLGTCEDGDCSYVPVNNDCTDLGLDCLGGECLDACADVTCDTPPEDGCDGDDLVAYDAGPGTCAVGECLWDELSRTDCTASGRNCVDGACVDLCTGVVCTTRPPRECIGDIARSYGSIGTCAFGECSYPPLDEDCQDTGRVCVDGRCSGCAASGCDRSTLAECDGTVRITYAGVPPVCIEGQCHRDSDAYDCLTEGALCVDGSCVAPEDICAEVSCPVVDVCEGDVAVSRSGAGVCVEGPPTECDYSAVETRRTCISPYGCVAGECVQRPRVGDLVISEIFFDAVGTDASAEWVEIFNSNEDEIDLSGVEVTTLRGRVTFGLGVTIGPSEYLLLAAEGSGLAGVDRTFETAHLPFGNTTDTVAVWLGDDEIDAVTYDLDDFWPGGPGSSMALDPGELDDERNDRRFSWCDGGVGTPGAVNPSCF